MGKIVLKVARDRDLYAEWCNSVESPNYIGTRAEMLTHLAGDTPDGYAPLTGNTPQARLARADLGRFIDALLADGQDAAYGVLRPFKDANEGHA
ncbi:MAG: hypothetical protein ACRDRO_03960 [Pseudonocardiaceae bacterium]